MWGEEQCSFQLSNSFHYDMNLFFQISGELDTPGLTCIQKVQFYPERKIDNNKILNIIRFEI